MQVGWARRSQKKQREAHGITNWCVVLQVWAVYSDMYHTWVRMGWAYAYSGFVDGLSTGYVLNLISGTPSYSQPVSQLFSSHLAKEKLQ